MFLLIFINDFFVDIINHLLINVFIKLLISLKQFAAAMKLAHDQSWHDKESVIF